jgi:hypothetical protein
MHRVCSDPRRITATVLAAVCCSVLLYGCMATPSASLTHETRPPSAQSSSVGIVSLQTRGGTLYVGSGPNGIIYSVRDRSGSTVASDLREADLNSQFPEMHELVEQGIAWGSR